jgi:hypothetical protein
MLKKVVFVCITAIILLTTACSGSPSSNPTPVPTPEIIELYDDPFVPAYTADIAEVVDASDTIIIGLVEVTLPGELKTFYSSKCVETPANIRVIQSLKGNHAEESVFTIMQFGGVAGNVDFRPVSISLHTQGETYLFFINGDKVMHSEIIEEQVLGGYFFSGKTTDESISIIMDCVTNGRIAINLQQIKWFNFYMEDSLGDGTAYNISKEDLQAHATVYKKNREQSKTEKWDVDQWCSFLSDLDNCGVFNWDCYYESDSVLSDAYWALDMEIHIGRFSSQGFDVFPDEWDAFLSIIDDYFGTVESQP